MRSQLSGAFHDHSRESCRDGDAVTATGAGPDSARPCELCLGRDGRKNPALRLLRLRSCCVAVKKLLCQLQWAGSPLHPYPAPGSRRGSSHLASGLGRRNLRGLCAILNSTPNCFPEHRLLRHNLRGGRCLDATPSGRQTRVFKLQSHSTPTRDNATQGC